MLVDNPFREVPGDSARDREERLFEFLAQQLQGVHEDRWRAYSAETDDVDGVAYMALLLSNLGEGVAPTASDALDGMAQELLGERLSVDAYAAWLKRGEVDVNRLAGFLNHAVRHAA